MKESCCDFKSPEKVLICGREGKSKYSQEQGLSCASELMDFINCILFIKSNKSNNLSVSNINGPALLYVANGLAKSSRISGGTCDLMHSQFPIEGSLYRQYSQTSVGTPNYKQNAINRDYSYFQV